ncbi:hypothetical protein [Lacinutrix himadriensis]|uniref:hypothetical protein n=1 Tax=Lacinutrix himadriensis TaxID=641549 RepID=UPI0006E348FC|nr:hypothetical protein [Lacinutrix himadriensis]
MKLYGVQSESLREDLVDHICTYIESQDGNDFNALYQEALQKFGGYASFQNLQLETNFQKIEQQMTVLSKLQFIGGLLLIILLVLGFIFKIMHWPYANLFMLLSCAVLVMFLAPVSLYGRYKKSIHKFS